MQKNLLNQAFALHQQGELFKAKKYYQRFLKDNPNHPDALHLYGILLAECGEFVASLQQLEQAITLSPKQAHYHNSLGNVLKHLQRFAGAKKCYQTALNLDSDNMTALTNLAKLYYANDNFAKALQLYSKAIHLQPDNLDTHLNCGRLLLKMGKWMDALTQFNNILSLDPHHVMAHKYLADIYLATEDYFAAKKFYQMVLELEPTQLEAMNNLGVVHLKEENLERAMQHFTQVLAIDPSHMDARNNLAAVYLQQDRYENAYHHYAVLLKQKPDDVETHYNYAVAAMAIGKLNDAKDNFQKTLSLDPQNVDALINLAAVLLKLNKPQQAIEKYQQALSLNSDNKIALYMLQALKQDKTISYAPNEYVKNLFDNYAVYYEKHVADVLNYKVPMLLFTALKKSLPLKNKDKLTILDLGCGTGLATNFFAADKAYLVGVDLSEKMLAIAKRKMHYDELICCDILTHLQNTKSHFNLILAADVFVYMGALDAIFKEIYRILERDGQFAFTIEACKEAQNFKLQTTGRFAHNKDYILQLAKENGFNVIIDDDIVPRYQENKPLPGYLFVLSKNSLSFRASSREK